MHANRKTDDIERLDFDVSPPIYSDCRTCNANNLGYG